jgi:hypothetical protein
MTLKRPVLLALAILFGAATTAYSVVWMIHIRHLVGIGTNLHWRASHEAEVVDVENGSSAWQAGLRSGDRIVAVNGEKLDKPTPFYGYPFHKFVMLGHQGDVVQLSVLPQGEIGELTIRTTLTPYGSPSGLRGFALRAMNLYPLPRFAPSEEVSTAHTPLVRGCTGFAPRAHSKACGKSAATRAILSFSLQFLFRIASGVVGTGLVPHVLCQNAVVRGEGSHHARRQHQIKMDYPYVEIPFIEVVL